MSGQIEESDVARALAAFASPPLKYRVFARPPVPPVPLHTPEAELAEEPPPVVAAPAPVVENPAPPVTVAPVAQPAPPPPPPPLLVPAAQQFAPSYPPLAASPPPPLDRPLPYSSAAAAQEHYAAAAAPAYRPSIMDMPGRVADPTQLQSTRSGAPPVFGMFRAIPGANPDPAAPAGAAPLPPNIPLPELFRGMAAGKPPAEDPAPPSDALRDVFRRL